MEGVEKWSDSVENLLDEGDIDGAISLLESVILKTQIGSSSPSSNLQLATALSDLAKLYSSKGFSLKADEIQTKAFLIKQRAQVIHSAGDSSAVTKKELEDNTVSSVDNDNSSCNASDCNPPPDEDDDWEALADRAPNELFPPQHKAVCENDTDWEAVADCAPSKLFSPQHEAGGSHIPFEDAKSQTPKRRGRGTFLYMKNSLYSDEQRDVATISEDNFTSHGSEGDAKLRDSSFGTSHVLVLEDFPPSTRTVELEKIFLHFRDQDFVIRWVNDTVALAVFRTPSIAREAHKSINCPFTVRELNEDDRLLTSISMRDLEPPYPRPKTDTRTAQRLIAQGIGQKLLTTFGSSELGKQEEARRDRIVTRQNLRDVAWGSD
ncbi:PREDICTED: uncharacterized protein LOC104590320 isoform X2 [Nelumbo nucifera]|uniref:Uncharacterized protein LOC104590320 isoform X2 n=1 Tax=Nelumbo nucifera TaxID=4432 RepID=A0A1U7Z8C8_NELNU|nr:PREDICTED: uncharacterized protein LOC104590320 isoform X2 [Nelumbo nucifera]